MSAVAETTAPVPVVSLRTSRPSFMGAVRGEVLKVSRQGTTWAMLGVAILLFTIVTVALLGADQVRATLHRSPLTFFYNMLDVYLVLFDTGSGILLLIVTSRLVGMEYSSGTIRVLLARGTGRLQLLAAKLTTMVALGLAVLTGYLVLVTAVLYGVVTAWEGSFRPITSLPSSAWTDLEIALMVALVSIGVCILLGTTASVVGRSLAFGISAAIAFFPVDNFGTIIMLLVNRITHQQLWLDLTTYLLGPNLNVLPVTLETDHSAHAAFAVPLVKVDAPHSWIVIGVYAFVFLAVAVALTWRRDVLE